MENVSFSVDPETPIEFSRALRDGSLCISFQELVISGPEGTFRAIGSLFRNKDKFCLECTPSPGEKLPHIEQKEIYGEDDHWNAMGETASGLKLKLGGFFSGEFSNNNSRRNYDTGAERERFSVRPQWIELERNDHVPDEKLPSIIEDPEKVDEIIERRRSKGDSRFRAILANTRLRFQNGASAYVDVHPYFSRPAKEEIFDTLHGSFRGYRYAFRQSGDDIEVCLDTNGELETSQEGNLQAFNALLDAFSFLQGDDARPYQTSFERNGHQAPDKFRPHFSGRRGASAPCGGAYEFADLDDLATRILETAIAFFMSKSDPVVDQIKKYHWQLREAGAGSVFQLYSAMHLCSILEGIARLILRERAGWSKSKLGKKNAAIRFEAVCDYLGLTWGNQFEKVVSVWKNPRNALAHGDLFSEEMEESQIEAIDIVSGGIIALMLKAMGWSDPIDFDMLLKYRLLYYKGSDGIVYRRTWTSHC